VVPVYEAIRVAPLAASERHEPPSEQDVDLECATEFTYAEARSSHLHLVARISQCPPNLINQLRVSSPSPASIDSSTMMSGSTRPPEGDPESTATTQPAATPSQPSAPSLTAEERRLFDLFAGFDLSELDWPAFKGTYKGE